jgi:hypothetical protein
MPGTLLVVPRMRAGGSVATRGHRVGTCSDADAIAGEELRTRLR